MTVPPMRILKCFVSSSFKLLAVEASLGRLFHSLIYLAIKKYLLLFRLNFSVAYSYQITSTHSLLLLNHCHSSHIFILSRHQSINQYSPPCLGYMIYDICPYPHYISCLLYHLMIQVLFFQDLFLMSGSPD